MPAETVLHPTDSSALRVIEALLDDHLGDLLAADLEELARVIDRRDRSVELRREFEYRANVVAMMADRVEDPVHFRRQFAVDCLEVRIARGLCQQIKAFSRDPYPVLGIEFRLPDFARMLAMDGVQTFDLLRRQPLACQLDDERRYNAPDGKEIIHRLQGKPGNAIAAAGDSFNKTIVVQPVQGLAHGHRPEADLFGYLALGKAHAGRHFQRHDALPEKLIDLIGKCLLAGIANGHQRTPLRRRAAAICAFAELPWQVRIP